MATDEKTTEYPLWVATVFRQGITTVFCGCFSQDFSRWTNID